MTRNIDLWGTAIVAGAIFSAVSNLGAQNNPGGSAQPQQQSQGGRQQNISADQCQRAKDSVDAKYSDGISHLNAAFAQNRNNPRFSQAKYNEYLSELKRLHDQGMTQAIKNNCTVSSQPPADQFNTQTGGQQAQQNQPQGNPNQGGQTDLGGGGPLGGSPNQPIRGGVQQNVPAPAPPSGPVVADQFNSGGGSQPNSETGVIVSITNLRNGNCDVKIKNPRTGYVHSVTVLCGTVATFKAGDSVIESRNPRGQVALTRPGQSEPADQFSSNSGTASSGGSQPPAEGPGVIVSITPFGNGDWDVKIKKSTHRIYSQRHLSRHSEIQSGILHYGQSITRLWWTSAHRSVCINWDSAASGYVTAGTNGSESISAGSVQYSDGACPWTTQSA